MQITKMKRIAIFASGSGTNAEAIMKHFEGSNLAKVCLLVSNKADAYALKRAAQFKVPTFTVHQKEDFASRQFVKFLKKAYKIDLIILAGYLWLIPKELILEYPNKIVNIHPALLPDYGGKGMYGDRVHEAVVANKEKESGITIHYVNENYDEGHTIYQESFKLKKDETPETLASKIHELEHKIYPHVIEQLIRG